MSARCFFGLATEEDGSRVLVVRTGENTGDADCRMILTPDRSFILETAQKSGTRKPMRVVIPSGQAELDFELLLDQLFRVATERETEE